MDTIFQLGSFNLSISTFLVIRGILKCCERVSVSCCRTHKRRIARCSAIGQVRVSVGHSTWHFPAFSYTSSDKHSIERFRNCKDPDSKSIQETQDKNLGRHHLGYKRLPHRISPDHNRTLIQRLTRYKNAKRKASSETGFLGFRAALSIDSIDRSKYSRDFPRSEENRAAKDKVANRGP